MKKYINNYINKIEKIFVFSFHRILWIIKPGLGTSFICAYFKKKGMKINGLPNYLSAKIWFDGTDYSLIELNEGCTISSNVRILTHDWALNTVAREMDLKLSTPIGIIRSIRVGRNAFVGTGSILMPGCNIGNGSIIGAGSIVRGKVPDFSIYVGNPGKVVGNSREYVKKHIESMER